MRGRPWTVWSRQGKSGRTMWARVGVVDVVVAAAAASAAAVVEGSAAAEA